MRPNQLNAICAAALLLVFSVIGIAQEPIQYQTGFQDYVLLVYEDTECPACAASFDDTHEAVKSLQIPMERIIFPVTTGRLESEIEGLLSHCFRQVLGSRHQDTLVKMLHGTNLSDAKMMVEQLAIHAPEMLGGRMEKTRKDKSYSAGKKDEILACYDDPAQARSIEESIKMGFRYDVTGTPTYQLLNWKTLGIGSVTGVPNTAGALSEWIATTASLTDEVAETDEFEIEEFLTINPVLRQFYEEYRAGRPGPASANLNSEEDVQQVIRDVFKEGFLE